MRHVLRRVRHLLRQRQREAELNEEMDFHREMTRQSLERAGADRHAAEHGARKAMGSTTLALDQARDVWIPQWLQGVGQDLRIASRMLRRTPLVTMIAVLSLGLGIGANTAIFSVFDSLVLRSLSGVRNPHDLVALALARNDAPGVSVSRDPRWSYVVWTEIEPRAQAFGGACAWASVQLDVSTGGERQPAEGLYASGGLFDVLGVSAHIGRTLTTSDDVNGAPSLVAVISHGLWQRRFAGSAQVLGTPLVIGRTTFTVVGVLPPAFLGPEVGRRVDIVIPLHAEPFVRGNQSSLTPPEDRFNQWLTIALRLAPGQSVERATALLHGMQPQIRDRAQPQSGGERDSTFLRAPLALTPIGTGTSSLRRVYRHPLLVVLVIVGLVLLVACVNIAHLQSARALSRRHEFGVRCAIGAGRWRLTRQLLIESLMMAAAGTGLGLVVAQWGGRLLVSQISTSSQRVVLDLPLDWRVLAFTATTTVVTALIFGLAPARLAGRASPAHAMQVSGRRLTADPRQRGPGGAIAVQVALSLVVLVVTGLFVRTFQHLTTRSLGFDTDRVLVARVNTVQAAVDPSQRADFFQRLIETVAIAPGVARAAGSMSTPVDGSFSNVFVLVSGMPRDPVGPRNASRWTFVTPGWFDAYGIPMHAGRDFTLHDSQDGPPVVIVNQTFARRLLRDELDLGRTVEVTGGNGSVSFGTMAIVGVVSDSVYGSLREEPQPTMYFPLAQWFLPNSMNFALSISMRARSGPPSALVPTVSRALDAVDPTLTATFRTLETQVADSITQERLLARLSASFAALALVLAALGLYGVSAYAVIRRRPEIAVRLALGASRGSIISIAASRVSLLVAVGLVGGLLISLALSRLVAGLVYGLTPQDPSVLTGAVAALSAVALVAAGLPAWRAAQTDPAAILRQQ